MKRMHFFQHVPFETSGIISRWAVNHGFTLSTTKFFDNQKPPDMQGVDWLVIMGGPDELRQAEGMIDQLEVNESANTEGRFDIFEIQVGDASKISGKVLSEIRFRQRYGVTVVGIRRGKDHITAPKSGERILAGDCLLVIGASVSVDRLKKEEPL